MKQWSQLWGKVWKLYQTPSSGPQLLAAERSQCWRLRGSGLQKQNTQITQGELYPQKVEVHCKQEGGAKVTEAVSPLLLLPRSTVCGGCKEENSCKEEFPGSQEGFVMRVGCVHCQVLWE